MAQTPDSWRDEAPTVLRVEYAGGAAYSVYIEPVLGINSPQLCMRSCRIQGYTGGMRYSSSCGCSPEIRDCL